MKISQTAFYFLNANTHSTRREIRHLMEDSAFEKDEDLCKNAERNLLQPNKRVEQEVAWLPGVPPSLTQKLVEDALHGRFSRKIKDDNVDFQLPALAACNLLTECITHLNEKDLLIDHLQLETIIRTAAEAYEKIDLLDVIEKINADRQVSGFPVVTDTVFIEEGIELQRKELRASISTALCKLDKYTETELLTHLVVSITDNGSQQNLSLLDEIIAEYEIHRSNIHGQIEKEIDRLIDNILEELSDIGEDTDVESIITSGRLESIKQKVDLWKRGMYPILLSYKSKGSSHKQAENLVANIREFYIRALESHGNGTACSVLCESIAFVVDVIPKYADIIRKDLDFLQSGLREILVTKKLQELCREYTEVPKNRVSLKKKYSECIDLIQSSFSQGEIQGEAANWLCLLLIRYGTALANRYGDFNAAVEVFDVASNYSPHSDISRLLYNNRAKAKANPLHLEKRIEKHNEAQRQYELASMRATRSNRIKNWCTAIICLILMICATASIFYIKSPEYEWKYLTSVDNIYNQSLYLSSHPNSPNKKKLTTLIAKQIRSTSPIEEQQRSAKAMKAYALDQDALFQVFTENPSLDCFDTYEILCPNPSPKQKDAITKIKIDLAEAAWNAVPLSLPKNEVEAFVAKYEKVINREEIDRRIYANLIKSDDKNLICNYRDFMSTKQYDASLLARIEKLEMDEWNNKCETFSTVDELVSYEATISSEAVKKQVNQKREELEWEQWLTVKNTFQTVDKLLGYISRVRNKEVKAEAEKVLEVLEKQDWLRVYQSLDTEQKLTSYKQSLKSKRVKELVDLRIKELYSDFSFVEKINTKEAYNRFILQTTNPKAQEKARQKIIDLEVAEIAKGNHTSLPEQHGKLIRSNRSGYCEIEIQNDTAYTLTVMYSGPQSEKTIVPAKGKRHIRIKAGNYSIAVTTQQPNVVPFYGIKHLSSGKYQTSYYISSSSSKTSSDYYSPDLYNSGWRSNGIYRGY